MSHFKGYKRLRKNPVWFKKFEKHPKTPKNICTKAIHFFSTKHSMANESLVFGHVPDENKGFDERDTCTWTKSFSKVPGPIINNRRYTQR